MGSGSMSASTGAKATNGAAGTTIFGLLAFGIVSMLFGLSQLPGPHGTAFDVGIGFPALWVTGPVVAASMTTLGGLLLALVGLVMLFRSQDPFWAVSFTGYGAFWAIWSGVSSTTAAHLAGYGTAGFAFVWFLFTLTFLINSFKRGWMTFLLYLVVAIGFILLVIEFWQWGGATTVAPISGDELGAIGGFWIVAGILAWYAGTARLTELNWDKRLPFS